ncbi:hypothetical protein Tco_0528103 [Tanacetum coccineum]
MPMFDKSSLDASAKLTWAELNKCFGDAGFRSGVTTIIPEKLLGDEGPSSGGTKLKSTFVTAEVTFTKRKQPT